MFLPPTSQLQPCNMFNYTGIANGNVSDVLVDCEHNDWDWISSYLPSTETSQQYAVVRTPLIPSASIAVANLGTPGGRDLAVSWTDTAGRHWLFGGKGLPFPPPHGKHVPPASLTDLRVFTQPRPP